MSQSKLIELPGQQANLADALDRLLNRGAVLRGQVLISVANIDLLYLDLRLFLSSIDKAIDVGAWPAPPEARALDDGPIAATAHSKEEDDV
jgi:gas vesicle structural protein